MFHCFRPKKHKTHTGSVVLPSIFSSTKQIMKKTKTKTKTSNFVLKKTKKPKIFLLLYFPFHDFPQFSNLPNKKNEIIQTSWSQRNSPCTASASNQTICEGDRTSSTPWPSIYTPKPHIASHQTHSPQSLTLTLASHDRWDSPQSPQHPHPPASHPPGTRSYRTSSSTLCIWFSAPASETSSELCSTSKAASLCENDVVSPPAVWGTWSSRGPRRRRPPPWTELRWTRAWLTQWVDGGGCGLCAVVILCVASALYRKKVTKDGRCQYFDFFFYLILIF